MRNPLVDEFISELKSTEIVSEDFAEEELYRPVICEEENDKRLEILHFLVSKFSEDYDHKLKKSGSMKQLQLDLTAILNELQFTNLSNKATFVSGNCTPEEQKNIFKEIFQALKFMTISNKVKTNEKTAVVTPIEKVVSEIQYKKSLIKNVLTQNFDLNRANKGLEEAERLIESFNSEDKEPYETPPNESHDVEELSSTLTSDEVNNFCNTFNQCFKELELHLPQHAVNHRLPSDEFTTQVEKLHSALKSITSSL